MLGLFGQRQILLRPPSLHLQYPSIRSLPRSSNFFFGPATRRKIKAFHANGFAPEPRCIPTTLSTASRHNGLRTSIGPVYLDLFNLNWLSFSSRFRNLVRYKLSGRDPTVRPFILTAAFPPVPPSDLHPTHGMMGCCHPAIRHKTFISVRNSGLGESEIVLAPGGFLH